MASVAGSCPRFCSSSSAPRPLPTPSSSPLNFNGFVLLGMLGFLLMLRKRQDWWAGVFIGLTIAVKPVLAPLLLLALLNRQEGGRPLPRWCPLALLVVAWPMGVDSGRLRAPHRPVSRRGTRLLQTVRSPRQRRLLRVEDEAGVAAWGRVRADGGVLSVVLVPLLPQNRRAAVADGVLGAADHRVPRRIARQGYCSMLLFPDAGIGVAAGVADAQLACRLGVYGAFTFDSLYSDRWEAFGRILEYNKVTMGWSLLMIAVFCSLLFRYLDMRTAGVVRGRCWKNGHDAGFHGRRRLRADTRGYSTKDRFHRTIRRDERRERLTLGRVQGARRAGTEDRSPASTPDTTTVSAPVSGLRYRTVP